MMALMLPDSTNPPQEPSPVFAVSTRRTGGNVVYVEVCGDPVVRVLVSTNDDVDKVLSDRLLSDRAILMPQDGSSA